MADIGGGTGVLAMAAAAIWPARAIAGDIDPVATETARANVAANGFAGPDRLRHGRGLPASAAGARRRASS